MSLSADNAARVVVPRASDVDRQIGSIVIASKVDADFNAVLRVDALILQRVHHVEHEQQSQTSYLSILGMQVELRARTRIERPAVVDNSQNNLIASGGELQVDDVYVVVDIGIAHDVYDQFVDRQTYGIGRSLGNVVRL
jgi:hypothetical protein